MTKHSLSGMMCTVVMIVLLVSVYVINATAEIAQPEPIKLKVLVLPYLGFAPFFFAEEEGYFTEQGLQVEFIEMAEITQAIPALIQGDLDVIAGDIRVSVLNAIAHGELLRIVADKGHIPASGCPYLSLFARRTAVEKEELNEPADLHGQRIAVNRMGTSEYYVEKMLNAFGLTLDDVVLNEKIPAPVRPEALKNGAVDLIVISEPMISHVLRAGYATSWHPPNQVIPNLQFSVIMYGRNLINNRDAGQRFMVAYLKGVRQYNQGKTSRNLDIMAKYTHLEHNLLQEACWASIYSDGHINPKSVIDFQIWALEKGWLDTVIPEDRFWDNSFIEYANQILDTSTE